MLRVPLNKAYLKRTIRPTYAFSQATPVASILDPGWTRAVAIYPGMVAAKTQGHNVTLIGGAPGTTAAIAFGLFGEYIGGDGIDEPLTAGVNVTAVWVLGGPDAEFEILAPAFDPTGITAASDPTTGATKLLNVNNTGANQGKLTVAAVGAGVVGPVCRLISVDSATKITVAGLSGTI